MIFMIRFHAPSDIPSHFPVLTCFIMKRIIIVRSEKPSRQWQAWLDALAQASFEINAVDPLSMELPAVHASPGDVVLFDGMLPNLSRFIQLTSIHSPHAQIIVATAVHSFTIKYEVMHLNGTIYLSGPLAGDSFIDAICKIAVQSECSAA